jgi:ParB/RepB/Spo0J family partition protein
MTGKIQYVVEQIEYSRIVAGNNDRKKFNEKELRELAESIEAEGLLQPLSLRPLNGGGQYQIVAGERRFRAMGLLAWEKVPAIVTSMDDERASVAMLAENVHRVDLDPIEEAKAYAGRMEQFGWSVEECAQKAKVTSHRVSARIALLELRQDLQHLVSNGQLKNGYAQIITSSGLDENFQLLATRALRENPAPNTQWFARTCADLAEQQNQAYLFDDMELFGGELKPMFEMEAVEKARPALPLEVEAPVNGASPEELIENQIAFWSEAAEQWDELCHAYYWRECESAVKALEMALAAVKNAPQKEKLF